MLRSAALAAVFLTCSGLLCPCVLAAPDMQPGRWEITSTFAMPDMAFRMPTTKHTQCIAPEDLIPRAQQENEKCQLIENAIVGDTVSWQVVCESGGGTMNSQGKVVYHGDSFEGTVITTGSQMPAGMTQQLSGKRIGDCE